MSFAMTMLLGAALPGGRLLAVFVYKVVEAVRIMRRINAPRKAERLRIMQRLREIDAEMAAIRTRL